MGWVYYLKHALVTVTMLSDRHGVAMQWSVSISFLSLWAGLPLIMVAMSLGIAAGKEGLQSYTSDKQ